MEFHNKHSHYFQMKGVSHLDADCALLKQRKPDAKTLRRLFDPNKVKLQSEILWELLDVATVDEILDNRGTKPVEKSKGKGKGKSKKAEKETPEPENVTEKPENVTQNAAPEDLSGEGEKKKLTKEQEYPLINWENLENPDIQKATILYNDRIYTFRKMVTIDRLIDQEATTDKVSNLAELRIRNLMCFQELKSFNDTGKFRMEHPLIRQYSIRAELQGMLKRNPEQYLDEYRNVSNNVARYKSFLNRDKKDKKATENWKTRLNEHQEREQLMKEILSEQTNA